MPSSVAPADEQQVRVSTVPGVQIAPSVGKAVLRGESVTLGALMGLPERVQRRLAGRPVVVDGQTLAVDLQLMLRLQRIVRERGAEELPLEQGRRSLLRHTTVTAGRQHIRRVRDLRAGGCSARLYTPSAAIEGALLVFFHGGGFMYGDLESHDPACRFLAERSGVRVLAVDYRLSPEHRFPAAYDDAVSAYRWVVDNAASLGADPQRIGVGGDSAGGNLAAGVAIEAARTGLPCAWQLLVYPFTDATAETESRRLFRAGFYLTAEFIALSDATYPEPGADLRDPRLSPLHAELPEGLAPAYVATAGFDPLRDEGEAYARKLEDARVPVELRRFSDQIHGFFNIVGVGRSSQVANLELASATRAQLAPSLL
jgi:acetyl esterase